jgi:hypothetical protein
MSESIADAEHAAGLTNRYYRQLDLIEARQWINKVRRRQRVTQLARQRVPWVEVIPGRNGSGGSFAPPNKIIAPAGARSQPVIVHQFAHLVTRLRFGEEIAMKHSAEWRALYVALMSNLVGQHEARLLRRELRARRLPLADLNGEA